MRRTILLAALLLPLSLGACVSVEATRLGHAAYSPVPESEVVVYQRESDVRGAFEKVAVVYVEGNTDFSSRERMVDAARKKAARLGANAIVLSSFQEPSTLERVAAHVLDVQTNRRTEILAIRVAHEAHRP